MPANPTFRSSTLERDFYALFGREGRWVWPFVEGGLVGTIFSLGVTTLLVQFVLSWFVHLHLGDAGFVGLALVVFLWECIRINHIFLQQTSLRTRLRAKYFPVIQNTEAFGLLMDTVEGRRSGTLDGCETKEASDALLLKLWYACFAEAERLQAPLSTTVPQGDILEQRSVADQIAAYLEERQQAHLELES